MRTFGDMLQNGGNGPKDEAARAALAPVARVQQ